MFFKNPLIKWLLILNLLCALGYGISALVKIVKDRRPKVTMSEAETIQGLAGFVRLEKTLPDADADRLTQIALKAHQTGQMADEDLRFLLSLMTNPPGRYSPTTDLIILNALRKIKNPTVTQRETLVRELSRVLTRGDDSIDPEGEAKMSACSYLGKTLREKSVAPLVRPLLTDSRRPVRRYAERYFKETGQKP